MKERGFPALMVGYAMNHGPGTYRFYNPETKIIIFSKDVSWSDYKQKVIKDKFDVFSPGVRSDGSITCDNLILIEEKNIDKIQDKMDKLLKEINDKNDETESETSKRKRKTRRRKQFSRREKDDDSTMSSTDTDYVKDEESITKSD